MKPFVRPTIDIAVFRDADGDVIDYGRRWWPTGDEGPDDTYSVTLHPERFAPLRVVAEALVEHLERTYDLTRSTFGDDIHLVPAHEEAAPLVFRSVSSSPVTCTAGIATDIAWFCPCDHCDEDLMVAIDRLEREVAMVAGGRLREWLEETDDGWWVRHRFVTTDDDDDSHGSSTRVARDQEAHQQEVFRTVPFRWAPWPLRADS